MGRKLGGDAGGGKSGSNVTYQRRVPKFLREYYAAQGEEFADSDKGEEDNDATEKDQHAGADPEQTVTGKMPTNADDAGDDDDEDVDEIGALQDSGFVVVDLEGAEESRKRYRPAEPSTSFGRRDENQRARKETRESREQKPVKSQNKSLLSFDEEGDDDDGEEDEG